MIAIKLTDTSRRWFYPRRRLFVFDLPESWAEVPFDLRTRYYPAAFGQVPFAQSLLTDLAGKRRMKRIGAADAEQMKAILEGLTYHPDCSQLVFERYPHPAGVWVGPKPNGGNMTCGEFMVADMLYTNLAKAANLPDAERLALLLWREQTTDESVGAERGDQRVPFTHDAQLDLWRGQHKVIPAALIYQALAYMGGLKQVLTNLYGGYIFAVPEEPDHDDDLDVEMSPSSDDANTANFGWLGVLQQVAAAGVFGTLDQVYQTNLHSVCIWLVQRKMEQRRLEAAQKRKPL